MNHKYSGSRIAEYSQRLASTLAGQYFQQAETINGQQLITFSPVRQINLFLIKELLGRWHQETGKLQSPYFDFGSPAVKESLAQFMNVLSQHILIRRPAFEPLLQQAIENTLWLSLDPARVFEREFLQAEEVSADQLRSNLKYLDHPKQLFRDFIDDLHSGHSDKAYVLNRFRLYVSAHYKDFSNTDSLLSELQPLLPLRLQDLEEAAAAPAQPAAAPRPAPAPPAAAPVPAPAMQRPVTPPAPVSPPAPAATPTPAPVPAPVPQPVVAASPTPAPVPAPAPVQVAPVTPPAPRQAAPAAPAPAPAPTQAPAGDRPLYERFRTDQASLNDALRQQQSRPSIADATTGQKIESLQKGISINQRFSFINELFKGDNQAYHAAINQLDQEPTLDAARDYVFNKLAPAHSWSTPNEHVNKLMRLLERKFA